MVLTGKGRVCGAIYYAGKGRSGADLVLIIRNAMLAMGNETSSDQEREDGTYLQRQGEGHLWNIHHGPEDDDPVCVFTRLPGSGSLAELCEEGVEQLRLLRHPNILKYILHDIKDDCISMVTEPVVLVGQVVEDVTVESLVMGWRGVCEGLGFLHDKAHLSHNNISPECVFVSVTDSQWKIGGFEAAAPHKAITLEFLAAVSAIRNPRAVPPEDKEKKLQGGFPCHSRDVWALGHMIIDLLEQSHMQQHASDTLLTYIQDEMLNSDPHRRPTVQDVLKQPWMSNEVSEISEFLSHLTLKSKSEKEVFFNSLCGRLHSVSSGVVAEHLVPLLLTPLVMAEPAAMTTLWPHLLTPFSQIRPRMEVYDPTQICPLIEKMHFIAHVVPLILNLSESRERHVRLLLLQNMAGYASIIQQDDLLDIILPEVLLGLRDSDDVMVEATLHALAELVPLLGADAVLGSSRGSVFTDAQPRLKQPLVVAVGNHSSPPAPITAPPASHRKPHPPARSAEAREKHQEEMKRKREEQRLKLAQKKLGSVSEAGLFEEGDEATEPEGLSTSAGQSYSPSVSHDGSHGDGGDTGSLTPLSSTPIEERGSEVMEDKWEGLEDTGVVVGTNWSADQATGGWSFSKKEEPKHSKSESEASHKAVKPQSEEAEKGRMRTEDIERLEQQASWTKEPDFFADMEPAINKKSSGTLSLQYQPQTGAEEAGEGWADDDWGSF